MTTQIADVECAILAGGLGTRLRPAVGDVPKVLAEVAGRPFITYLLDAFARAGLRHAILCTGYAGEQVAARLGKTWGPLRLSYSQETTPLGTGGALRSALSLVTSSTLFACNGDSYCRADLAAFLRRHEETQACCSLLLTQVPDVGRYGQVVFEPDGAITQFVEKGSRTGPGWINAGVYLFRAEALACVPVGEALSLERDILPEWIGQGLFGYPGGTAFLDIGTPESLREAEAFLGDIVP